MLRGSFIGGRVKTAVSISGPYFDSYTLEMVARLNICLCKSIS